MSPPNPENESTRCSFFSWSHDAMTYPTRRALMFPLRVLADQEGSFVVPPFDKLDADARAGVVVENLVTEHRAVIKLKEVDNEVVPRPAGIRSLPTLPLVS